MRQPNRRLHPAKLSQFLQARTHQPLGWPRYPRYPRVSLGTRSSYQRLRTMPEQQIQRANRIAQAVTADYSCTVIPPIYPLRTNNAPTRRVAAAIERTMHLPTPIDLVVIAAVPVVATSSSPRCGKSEAHLLTISTPQQRRWFPTGANSRFRAPAPTCRRSPGGSSCLPDRARRACCG